MEDAVEEFVGLDGPAPGRRKARQADDFGLDEEEGVYQLELDDSDDEDDDDLESSEDDEDGDDAMMMPRGRGAGLDEDDEEDDNEDDDEDDEDDDMDDDVSDVDSEADDAAGTVGDPTKGWGRRKSDYYHGDTADLEIGQDFEDAEEEEEAAREMRSAELKGLEGAEDSFFGDLLSGAPAAPALKKGGKKKGAKAKAKAAADPDDVEIAHVSRDLAGLSKKEKLQILMSR
uniref:Uncharacterized protein n=2 Tax=Phaeomonas parva TaxID=124430 RepID=A0A7S1XTG6_9STRA|mmetsp:Transcript_31876/g.101481  ORF Transcript_31876/g.101481 Transcript_31876/m.101481 type:complete len:230 (+) Transcript_31876:85-774(+)